MALMLKLFIWQIVNSLSRKACALVFLREVVIPIKELAQNRDIFPSQDSGIGQSAFCKFSKN